MIVVRSLATDYAVTFRKPDMQYELVTTSKQLHDWCDRLAASKQFAIDTETTGKDPMTCDLVGVCLAVVEDGRVPACYIPVGHTEAACQGVSQLALDVVLKALAPFIADKDKPKILQNAIYDLTVLGRYGVEFQNVEDTMFMDYALTAGSTGHGMDEMAERYLGHRTIKFGEVVSEHPLLPMEGFQDVRLDHATHYAAEDTEVTLRLFFELRKQLKAAGLWKVYDKIDRPLIMAGAAMKRNGIAISKKACARLATEWNGYVEEAATELQQYAPGINVGSTQQVQKLLFDVLELPVLATTDSGAPSTGIETLELLEDRHPAVAAIVKHRKYAKLVGTYAGALPEKVVPSTGRLHPSMTFTFTQTGRLSCSDALQGIPSPAKGETGVELRKAFASPRGYKILAADYGQIELRVLAHVTQDPVLLRAFREGMDLHTLTACKVFGHEYDHAIYVLAEDANGTPLRKNHSDYATMKRVRRFAKTINFGLIYGMSAFGLSHQLKIDETTAQGFIDQYFAEMLGVTEWIESTQAFARQNRYVDTIFGRRLYTNSNSGFRAERSAERQGGNYVIQGSAADLIRLAMPKVSEAAAEYDASLLLQVHDELLLETPDEHADILKRRTAELMRTAGDDFIDWSIPITVDAKVGSNWAEAH